MPRFCNQCGASILDGVKFCPNCGNTLQQSSYQQQAQPQYQQQTPPQYQQPQYQQAPPQYQQQQYQQPHQTYYQMPQPNYGYGGQMPYQQPQKKRSGCGTAVLIVFLIILVGLGVGGYFLYKAGKSKVEELKTKFEETYGQSLSSFIEVNPEMVEELKKQGIKPKDLKKLEKMGIPSEIINELEKQMGESETAGTSSNPKKSKGNGKIKVKDAEFFGVTLPIPNAGKVLKYDTETNSFGDKVTEIRIEGLSYDQFIEYCKMLEALPGWEVKNDYDIAHFPSNPDDVRSVEFKGQYKTIPHIALDFYSRQGKKAPDFQMMVFESF